MSDEARANKHSTGVGTSNLDLSPIHLILWKDLHKQGSGRPVEYQPNWDLKDLMLRQLLQIPYMKYQVKRLKRNPYLRHACDYWNKAPTESSLLADEETDRG